MEIFLIEHPIVDKGHGREHMIWIILGWNLLSVDLLQNLIVAPFLLILWLRQEMVFERYEYQVVMS